jgi:hypothetical protein
MTIKEFSMQQPPHPNKIGSKGRMTDISGQRLTFMILDEIVRPQSTNPDKVIYLQKIKFEQTQKIEYRIAYYIIGKKPKMAGKWVFGQYATLMTAEDFEYLITETKKKGWIGSI